MPATNWSNRSLNKINTFSTLAPSMFRNIDFYTCHVIRKLSGIIKNPSDSTIIRFIGHGNVYISQQSHPRVYFFCEAKKRTYEFIYLLAVITRKYKIQADCNNVGFRDWSLSRESQKRKQFTSTVNGSSQRSDSQRRRNQVCIIF